MADEQAEGTPLTITNEMVAQFMLTQQSLNERLQETTDQMNVRLQTLLTVANDATTTVGGANTPLTTRVLIPQLTNRNNK
jgi:hypothetical protein